MAFVSRTHRAAVAVLLGLVSVALITPSTARFVLPTRWHEVPHLASSMANALSIIAMVVLIRTIGGVSLRAIWRDIGLQRPRVGVLLSAGLLAALGGAAAATIGLPRADVSLHTTVMLGMVYPLAEEVVFRGLAIGVLLREAKWAFAPAILASSLVFGLAHTTQGNSLGDSAGVAAITFVGGAIFGWLYRQWDFDLWPAVLLHAGLNTLFELFVFGDDARGTVGWNVLRLALVIAAEVLTMRYGPRESGGAALVTATNESSQS
jgi:uncharacterized protein